MPPPRCSASQLRTRRDSTWQQMKGPHGSAASPQNTPLVAQIGASQEPRVPDGPHPASVHPGSPARCFEGSPKARGAGARHPAPGLGARKGAGEELPRPLGCSHPRLSSFRPRPGGDPGEELKIKNWTLAGGRGASPCMQSRSITVIARRLIAASPLALIEMDSPQVALR